MKRIIFIHGRSTKPSEDILKMLWVDAVGHGLLKDAGKDALKIFQDGDIIKKDFVYYGDLTNQIYIDEGENVDPVELGKVRKQTLEKLIKRDRRIFLNKSKFYKHIGVDAKATFQAAELADHLARVAGLEKFASEIIEEKMSDMRAYWDKRSDYSLKVKGKLLSALTDGLNSNDDIMLISHSMGTMVAYDCLWTLCNTQEIEPGLSGKKVSTWLTLGSPLGISTVKEKLLGYKDKVYPTNYKQWINVAAKYDEVAADDDLYNDYEDVLELGVDSIEDEEIYNFATRNGEPNTHSSLGYLIHPKVTRIIQSWMER